MLIVLFGLPGAGKTYAGKILKDHFGFSFYEGDRNITSLMKQRLKEQKLFTRPMRKTFFENLVQTISRKYSDHKKVVISQTFIKEAYRKQFLKHFPNAHFILVQTESKLREKRLRKRKSINDILFLRKMTRAFEKPDIKHTILRNNEEGIKAVKQQLEKLLNKLHQEINET